MPLKTFSGGIHPLEKTHHGKGLSEHLAITKPEAPRRVKLPMAQHIGAPCRPLVVAGDRVLRGQLIGETGGFVSAPVHASVSGAVLSVQPERAIGGQTPLTVTIENDFKDETVEFIPADPAALSREELLKRVAAAGLAGMGGAAFPLHVKLSPPEGTKIDYLLLNGAECEPYLTADHRMMLERGEMILKGAAILKRILDADAAIIGIEANKQDAIANLERLAQGSGIKIQPLRVKYPQGSEKQIIQSLTGRQVPSGKLPAAAGCVVVNVSTAHAVYEAVALGKPLIDRVLTVTGEGIETPANLEVPIGTEISHLIACCGGLKDGSARLVSGGPMMGIAVFEEDLPIVKGSSGILALLHGSQDAHGEGPCIHCGRCSRGCPIHLQPYELYSDMLKKDWAAAEKHGALDCVECGACSYICPARREVTSAIRVAKRQAQALKRK
ncbi:MAG: electron transport complex subunit RsxC [Christensenellaceae bacterium]|nr:electron transport complex subunit RsxC [Christensenellaceae bacterium]